MTIGVSIGMVSGYYGGLLDEVLMRLMDMIFAFPALLLAMALIAVTGASVRNIVCHGVNRCAAFCLDSPRFGSVTQGAGVY